MHGHGIFEVEYLKNGAIVLVLYYDVELHSLDYATAYCDVSIVPMAVCFNGETLLSPPLSTRMIIFFYLFLHFTIVQQISGV